MKSTKKNSVKKAPFAQRHPGINFYDRVGLVGDTYTCGNITHMVHFYCIAIGRYYLWNQKGCRTKKRLGKGDMLSIFINDIENIINKICIVKCFTNTIIWNILVSLLRKGWCNGSN